LTWTGLRASSNTKCFSELEATITYRRHAAIDKGRWDAALARFANGNIYATSLYLDHMSPGWEALVLGDYEALFPLPWRRKMGIHYLYQPFLTAQLGLFSAKPDALLLDAFLKAIPEKFRLIEMPLNSANNGMPVSLPLYQRVNYVLDLSPAYPDLQASYRENIRRNIKKAGQYGCYAEKNTTLEAIITLARSHADDEEGLEAFSHLFDVLREREQAMTYGIRSKEGALLASAVFLRDERRAYYILVGNHPNGRTLGASHLLIDSFIRDHAGSPLLLDFEGSDIRNLAFFYSSFGAKEELYPALKINRLPWWLRLIKNR
jgi:hypothetical protein